MSAHYRLQCLACGMILDDDGVRLTCPGEHPPHLLRTLYATARLEPDADERGIFRFRRWLPARRVLPGAGGPITFQSERLCRMTGMPRLWLSFSGSWPERGATLATSTFKELEAYAVLARLPAGHRDVLVVASAGNTAAAFARLCSQYAVPCLIVVPIGGLARMITAEPLHACVKVVAIGGCADYYDAIVFAERVARRPGFVSEGGVRNIARRDGLGTTMLHAVETICRLPDYYFQAVGSGSGGIAAHEAARRLAADGRFGATLPRLMLSQNLPFAPIYRAWQERRPDLAPIDRDEGKRQIALIMAPVLSNVKPPYAIGGGVFEALTESGGEMLAVENEAVCRAMALFEEAEGIDIDPAAGVALASLLAEAEAGRIERDALVLVNLTGGGWCRRRTGGGMRPLRPTLLIGEPESRTAEALERTLALF